MLGQPRLQTTHFREDWWPTEYVDHARLAFKPVGKPNEGVVRPASQRLDRLESERFAALTISEALS